MLVLILNALKYIFLGCVLIEFKWIYRFIGTSCIALSAKWHQISYVISAVIRSWHIVIDSPASPWRRVAAMGTNAIRFCPYQFESICLGSIASHSTIICWEWWRYMVLQNLLYPYLCQTKRPEYRHSGCKSAIFCFCSLFLAFWHPDWHPKTLKVEKSRDIKGYEPIWRMVGISLV